MGNAVLNKNTLVFLYLINYILYSGEPLMQDKT